MSTNPKLTFIILLFSFCFGISSCSPFQGPGTYRPPSPGYRSTPASPPTDSPKRFSKNYTPRRAFQLSWPVKIINMSRGFKTNKFRRHDGIDITGAKGTPILAAHDGIVVYAGRGYKGYGNMVLLEYSEKWASLYAHLNKIHVEEGQILERGMQLGTMGMTGRASGVHLHFELMLFEKPIDPLKELPRPPRKYTVLE